MTIITWRHLIDFEAPSVPNFVRSVDGKHRLDVGELNDRELEDVVKGWTAKLTQNRNKRRAER